MNEFQKTAREVLGIVKELRKKYEREGVKGEELTNCIKLEGVCRELIVTEEDYNIIDNILFRIETEEFKLFEKTLEGETSSFTSGARYGYRRCIDIIKEILRSYGKPSLDKLEEIKNEFK